MTRLGTALMCGAAALGLCLKTGAVPGDNPYKGIVERNLFGLKDPPPPPSPAELNKPQPSKIILTGITDILGRKQALMKVPAAPAKPGETPKGEQSFILTIGQREGEIEVLEIDPVAGMVKVRNAGVVEELTFEKNGPKLASAPAPGAPAAPGAPGIPMPLVGGTASATPVGGSASIAPGTPFTAAGLRSIPTRSVRTSGTDTQPPQPAYGASYGATYGATVAPGATAGTTAAGALNAGSLLAPASTPKLQPNWPPERNLTPEEHDILVEAQRLQKANDPNWPPLPPTSLSQLQQQEQQQQQQVQQQQQQQPQVPRPPGMPQF